LYHEVLPYFDLGGGADNAVLGADDGVATLEDSLGVDAAEEALEAVYVLLTGLQQALLATGETVL
jgi:hypothetical protein